VQGVDDWRSSMEYWSAPKPGRPVYLQRYEDVHADPRAALEGLLAFLNVTPDPFRLDCAVESAGSENLPEEAS
jgi:hypothetical protein